MEDRAIEKMCIRDRFNVASQMTSACQSDFMAVGGGYAIDSAGVPIREKCGLGQISAYVPSSAAAMATLQVDPCLLYTSRCV